ncbi:uncharacterized protein LOC111518928 [Drosophila willistoni]|uniref:uncharacterized protein LOC111518928 n=1 Tax=Drosophila willistoni TaxID=7260 RepID=UPI000C26CB67|nr:uncharacterized protein LOC111518928 [Drosophila willistoni]
MARLCFGRTNYNIRFESAVAIEGEEETLTDYGGLKLVGRERNLNGTVYYADDMTDEFEISCDLFSLDHGIWIEMPYQIKSMKFCEFARKFFVKYVDPVNANTNWPPTETDYCPLQKGVYWVKEWTPNTDSWVSYLRRGLVKLKYQIFKEGKVVGGMEFVANIIDRGT